jgi:hypothetical protein
MNLVARLVGRGLLLLAGLAVPLLALEVLVRFLGLAPPHVPLAPIWTSHPLYGWFHAPNAGGLLYNDYNEFQVDIRINARGLRDREIGYDNPLDRFRILILADSYGEAIQVPLEAAYSKRLETLLNTSNQPEASLAPAYEVINAGVGGWGTDQEATFYATEGFRYEPDLVILTFFARNDVVNNSEVLELRRLAGSRQKPFFRLDELGRLIIPDFPFEPAGSDPQPRPWLLPVAEWIAPRSELYRFAVPYVRDIPAVVRASGGSGILGGEGVVRANHPETPVPFFVYRYPLEPEFESAWSLTEALLRELRQRVEKNGAHLVVVIVAAPEQVYPDRWEGTLASYPALKHLDWDLDLPNRRLSSFLQEQDIPYLDLLPVFQKVASQADAPALHLRHDGHWTAAGHALAGEAIYQFLLDNGLVGKWVTVGP